MSHGNSITRNKNRSVIQPLISLTNDNNQPTIHPIEDSDLLTQQTHSKLSRI